MAVAAPDYSSVAEDIGHFRATLSDLRIDQVELERRVDRLTIALVLCGGGAVLSAVSFILTTILLVRL